VSSEPGNPGPDGRLDGLVEVILALCRLEFGARAEVGDEGDTVDALAAGLNMLGEELAASTFTASELERQVAERTAELAKRQDLLQTLLKEVHHRVKNNLQVVSSLLRLYSEEAGDHVVRDAFRQTGDRVRAMSIVHELLYRTENVGLVSLPAYLHELIAELKRGYPETSRISVELDAADLSTPIEHAVPLGLIVNELVSNAFKHAFPGGRVGRVRVSLRGPAAGVAPPVAELVVSDDGVGEPAQEAPAQGRLPRMGRELVRSLARQLRGAVVIEKVSGTTVRVTMQIEGGAA